MLLHRLYTLGCNCHTARNVMSRPKSAAKNLAKWGIRASPDRVVVTPSLAGADISCWWSKNLKFAYFANAVRPTHDRCNTHCRLYNA